MKKSINVIEIDDLNNIDYSKCGSFYKLKKSSYHYFIEDNNSYTIISDYFFNYINDLINDNKKPDKNYKRSDKDYSDTLIKLSGKYTAEDIIKFRNEGMI